MVGPFLLPRVLVLVCFHSDGDFEMGKSFSGGVTVEYAVHLVPSYVFGTPLLFVACCFCVSCAV
jgi:hypothetical protein